ncbi:hypothetical protein MMAD_28300 [Mycolicibacterium madagascariense]|uniref:DUF1616 domain-containing protein n=1 Tax=Mycolicibacterium madagascariense TaxID=212765 RepID=A0A7I7XHG2_9MYCO|nr:hypothetical protein [Mycolicibacterium madagascariense]MCV7014372.1 hypothetical protein [Mycolicibacterium madagascariense]BBZ28535.1 hypothetical protein MMAD_28300 [Mycolicibacterium madagascariense]
MTGLVKSTAIALRRIPSPGISFIVVNAVFGAAVLVVALQAPAAVRFPAVAALSFIPGAALVRLFLGDPGGHLRDPALRLPLSVLLGLLVWLGAALSLDAIAVPLAPRNLTLAVGAMGLVLITTDGVLRSTNPRRTTPRATWLAATRGAGIGVSVVVLGAAAYVASTMTVVPVERYTTLAFTDSKPYAGEVPLVAPARPVRLNWALRGFGCRPSPTLTSIRLAVDGVATDAVAVDTTEAPIGTISGAVTFTAPSRPGRYLVELTVVPTAPDGVALPAPGHVSTFVEVEK